MPDMEAKIVRGHLQNVSVKFRNAALINSDIYPLLNLATSKTKITKHNRGDQFRDDAAPRARGTEAAIGDGKTEEVNADTKQYARKEFVTDEDLRDAGLPDGASPPVNLVQDALERTAFKLDLRREVALASHIFAQTWADGTSGGKDIAGAWNDLTSSNPFLTEMTAAKKKFVEAGVGVSNLRLMLDFNTMEVLKRVAEIRDQLKYTSNQSLDADTLARLLRIEKVIVAESIVSTAKEKKDGTDFTGKIIWEKNAGKGSAFLYYYPPAPGPKTLAAGYQPRNKMPNGDYRLSKSYRMEHLGRWDYESQEEVGITTVALPAGYLMVDTLVT